MTDGRLRLLLDAPPVSRMATGEGFVAFKWAEALAPLLDLTVAAFDSHGHPPLAEQLPGARTITWPEPVLLREATRLRSMLKPEWPVFARHVRGHLRRNAGRFDIAHQIMPQGARYATPLRGHGLPYVVGPLGGSLTTPPAFAGEAGSAAWFTRLRGLDALRLRYDPWLRAGYAQADLVLGVAPYMREVLAAVPLRRYESVLELGVDDVAPERPMRAPGPIRLLHVGRGVRTKGLRDAVRALGLLRDKVDAVLESAGSGPEIEICRQEAARLGIEDRVTFHGLLPRDAVETLYSRADVFVFPSFREPAGNVLYEAMRWGLPVVAARRGGPEWIVDDTCGLRIEVTDPDRYARDIADAIEQLARDPDRRARLGAAARARIRSEGLWPHKAERLMAFYREVVAGHAAR